MKTLVTTITLLLVTLVAFPQDYMTKIAKESCSCVEDASREYDDPDEMLMQFGLCMIMVAEPYRKKLKKDYDIDFDHIERDAEKLGTLIGMKMAGECPETLIKLTKDAEGSELVEERYGIDDDDDDADESATASFRGTVTKVETDQFVVFTIEDRTGVKKKFIWLHHFSNSLNLEEEYNNMVGKMLKIRYIEKDLFDARISEYKEFNIMSSVELIEE